MKLIKWIKWVSVVITALTLVACATGHKKTNPNAVDEANASYGQAESAGIGEEAKFGEQGDADNRAGLANANRIYHFEYDSSVVREQDKPAIHANANYLISRPQDKIILEGHTDPRGSREYNIGLGERRAKAVADILTTKGVNPSQIRLVSYGAEKLAVPGHDESAYQQDRRAILAHLQG